MKQPRVQGSSVVAQIGGQRDQAMLQKGEAISKQDCVVGVVLVILVIVKVKTAVKDPIPQVLQLWTMSTRSTLFRIFV